MIASASSQACTSSTARTTMLWNGLRQTADEPGLARGLARQRPQRLRGERVAGERAGEVGAALAQAGVQCVGVLDVLLDDVLVELAGAMSRPAVGDDPAAVDRVARRARAARRSSGARSTSGNGSSAAQRTVARAVSRASLERVDAARAARAARGRAVEAADADVDRVDLAAADDRHQGVAGLLHLQALFDDLAVVARHLDGARVAEEVRRVQHVDVQAVALDPLAAVEQPAQVAQRARRRCARRRRPPSPAPRSSGRRPGRCRRSAR